MLRLNTGSPNYLQKQKINIFSAIFLSFFSFCWQYAARYVVSEHTYTSIHTFTYIYEHIYVHTYIYIYISCWQYVARCVVSQHTYTTYIHTHIYIHICTCIRMYARTHAHVYVCIYVHICMYGHLRHVGEGGGWFSHPPLPSTRGRSPVVLEVLFHSRAISTRGSYIYGHLRHVGEGGGWFTPARGVEAPWY